MAKRDTSWLEQLQEMWMVVKMIYLMFITSLEMKRYEAKLFFMNSQHLNYQRLCLSVCHVISSFLI